MPNMSYCRFHNTLADLRECMDYLDDPTVSEAEAKERKRLIKTCCEIAEGWGEEY